MKEYKYNEVMSWVVDWVNTTFTTLKDINQIEDVYVWGAPYRNVSFVDNVVTFAEPVPLWADQPTIDYFTVDDITVAPFSSLTFWELIDDVYDDFGEDEDSDVFPLDRVKKLINKAYDIVKNQSYYKERVRTYSFNKAKDGSTGIYTASGVDIWEQATYIPSSGVYVLRDAIIASYSSYTSWILNWASGVVYKDWEKYSVGYKLPSICKKPSEIVIDWYAVPYRDIREWSLTSRAYTIYYSEEGEAFLLLPFSEREDQIVTVRYIPKTSSLVDEDDFVDLEYEYSGVITEYVAYKLLLNREDERWIPKKREWQDILQEYKNYKKKSVDDTNNSFFTTTLSQFSWGR